MTSQLELISSMSATFIGANEDILTEILFRIPIKTVCQFKLVSKHWNSFISSPEFCRGISRLTCKRISCLLVARQDYTKYDIVPLGEFGKGSGAAFSKTFDYVVDEQPAKIMHACNGLLCLRAYEKVGRRFVYYVGNPTTRQFRRLPNHIGGEIYLTEMVHPQIAKFFVGRKHAAIAVHLAFDPRKSPHFKVLYVQYSKTVIGHQEMQIYSSETGQWRRTGDSFTVKVDFRRGVYWNGAMNWLDFDNGKGLYFNVDEERFQELPILPPTLHGQRDRYFGESNDRLFLIQSYDAFGKQYNVYEMDGEYSGWSIRYHLDTEVVAKAFLRRSYHQFRTCSLLSVVSGGIDKDLYVVLFIDGKAVCYNLETKIFKKIWNFDGVFCSCIETFQCAESLCTV